MFAEEQAAVQAFEAAAAASAEWAREVCHPLQRRGVEAGGSSLERLEAYLAGSDCSTDTEEASQASRVEASGHEARRAAGRAVVQLPEA